MKNVSSALSEYLNYARDLTSGLPTSNFELMEQSIILFNSYMAEDFKLAFQWVYKMGYHYPVMIFAKIVDSMGVLLWEICFYFQRY